MAHGIGFWPVLICPQIMGLARTFPEKSFNLDETVLEFVIQPAYKAFSLRMLSCTGFCCALGATMIWSGNYIVARGVHEMVQPATLAILRWGIACLVLFPLGANSLWQERQVIRYNLPYLLLVAFLGITLFNTLLYLAAHSTSALNMSLIATSTPVFIIVLSRILFAEAITSRRLLGLTLAILGVIVLITRGQLSILLDLTFVVGDFWMLLAALTFAVYSVLLGRKPAELSQTAFLLSIFLLGFLLLVPWSGAEISRYGLPQFSVNFGLSLLYIGLGASLISFFLWNKAIEAVGPSVAGLIYYSLPLFSGLGAFLLLGEPVGWVHALSGLCIFSGIVIATRN